MHLMLSVPGRYMDKWKKCGADIVTFHIEAVMDPAQLIRDIHSNGMKAGVAVKPATPVSAIEDIIKDVDMILIMSVEPGFGGQSFMPVALDKIRETRLLLEEYGLKTDIEVDGGINLKNVDEILEAGANVIVTGSAIFNEDIEYNVVEFKKHLDKN
jgi:Pentose-5-phosphate-3-epimerase